MDKIAEGVAVGLSGPSPSFAKMGAFLAKQAFKGIKDNVHHYQRGKGLGTVLSTAANIGYKLGKDKGYKRVGAVGATGNYKHFRKLCETWFVNLPVWLFLCLPAAGKVNWSNNSLKRKNYFIPLLKRWSSVTIDGNPDLTAWKKQSNVTFYKDLPPEWALVKWFKPHHHGILILDDLMEESGNNKRVLDLLTKDSHHRGITALYLTEDLFPPDEYSKTINRNAHYAISFKSPSDKTGIRNLLLQVYPEKWRRVLKLFLRLTARPFGYIMLDLHPASDDRFRLWMSFNQTRGHTSGPHLWWG